MLERAASPDLDISNDDAHAASAERRPIIIEFIADLVCPWCFIGKRRLDRALAMRPRQDMKVIWRSFLLNPDTSGTGIPLGAYLTRRAGAQDITRALDRLARAGTAEGIHFRLPRLLSSSIDAHRLIRFAKRSGNDARVLDAILRAYHEEERDIGNIDVLVDTATVADLDQDEVRDFLCGTKLRASVLLEHAGILERGLSGVPYLVIQERYAISGAQEPEFLLPLLDLAREEEAALVSDFRRS